MILNSPTISGSLTTSGSVLVNSPNTTMGQFVGNQNGYVEFSVRNASTGISASGDIAVYADNGTPTTNYIDMGINNSSASAYAYAGTVLGKALDAYLFNVGGNLIIGNANSTSTSQSLYFFANPNGTAEMTLTGSNFGIGTTVPNYKLDVSGSIRATGTIVAQTLVVQTVTSSIDYVTGSTQWGSVIGNTHTITGSLGVSGSTSIIGNVGIGIASPTNLLTVQGIGALAMYTGSNVSVKINTTDSGSGYFQVVSAGVNTMYVGSQGSWEGNSGMNGAVASINGLNFYTNGSSTPKITISTVGAFTYNASVGGLYAFGVNGSGSFVYGSSTATRHASFSYNTGDKPGVELGYDVTNNNGIIAGATQANGAGLDFWTYNGSAWASRFTINKSGAATFSSTISATGASFSTFLGVGGSQQRDPTGTRSLTISGVSSGYAASLDLYGSANNYAIYTGGAGSLGFYDLTNSAQRMTITNAGNVGIGTSSPSGKFEVLGDNVDTNFGFFSTAAATNRMLLVVRNTGNSATIDMRAHGSTYSETIMSNSMTNGVALIGAPASTAVMAIGTGSNSPLVIGTNNTERMRITGGGNVIHKAYNVGEGILWSYNGGATYGFYNNNSGGFTLTNSGVANVGVFNMSTGNYTPTSDFNKKKDFEQSTIGLKEILELKPTLYRMKTDDTEGDKELGFIAQEVKEFIPQAYVQSDDFIGLNFNPIVAALVKGMQEQQAQIEELKSQNDDLQQQINELKAQ